MTWKDRIESGVATWEDFHNCTVGKQFQVGCEIDPPMSGIISMLNENLCNTTACCYGHNTDSNAYVVFDSRVELSKVVEFMKFYKVPNSHYSVSVHEHYGYSFVKLDLLQEYKDFVLEYFEVRNNVKQK